jgi:broad specificity phosphatase PhoE
MGWGNRWRILKMQLYLVRHGQTDWNKNGILQGTTDIPLNEEGIKQAAKLAELLQNEKIDFIFSSPLCRAKLTAEMIAEKHELKVIEDKRLKEIDCGEWEGKNSQEIALDPRREQWIKYELNSRVPGGESIFDVGKRVFEFLDEIFSKYSGKNILMVGHQLVNSVIKRRLIGKPEDFLKDFMCKNAEFSKFEIEDMPC